MRYLFALILYFVPSVVFATNTGEAGAVADLLVTFVSFLFNTTLLIIILISVFKEKQKGCLHQGLVIFTLVVSVLGLLISLAAGSPGWYRQTIILTWTSYFIFYALLFVLCLIKLKFKTWLLARFGKTVFVVAVVFLCILAVFSGPSLQKAVNQLKLSSAYATLKGINKVDMLAVSPDSKTVALTGEASGTDIQIWSVEEGRVIKTLKGLIVLPEKMFYVSNTLVTIKRGGDIIVWDMEKGVPSKEFSGSDRANAMSPDFKWVAFQERTNEEGVSIYDWDTKTKHKTFSVADDRLIDIIAFSPNMKTLTAGGVSYKTQNAALIIWSFETMQPIKEIKLDGMEPHFYQIVYAPESQSIYAFLSDHSVWKYNIYNEEKECIGSFDFDKLKFGITLNPAEDRAATGWLNLGDEILLFKVR